MNIREIIAYVVIGALLLFGILTKCSESKQIKKVAALELEVYNYTHSPVRIDTVTDSIFLPGGVVIKPIPKIVIIHDTIIREISECWYDSIYTTPNLNFKWKSRVFGEMKDISFYNFNIKKDIITIQKPYDTCFPKEAQHIPMNHLGVDVNLIGNNFKQFPNADLIGWWSIKDRFKLNAGIEYSAYHGEVYGKVGIGVFLK